MLTDGVVSSRLISMALLSSFYQIAAQDPWIRFFDKQLLLKGRFLLAVLQCFWCTSLNYRLAP